VKNIDILCIGETLIDLIGNETDATLQQTTGYKRLLGGSPTNVAFNAAKLGLRAAIVSTVGNDGLGHFALRELEQGGVNTQYSRTANSSNTSIVMVSRSTGTPDFIAYRDADVHIEDYQLADTVLQNAHVYHTTCFALSKKPAQHTIVTKAKRAKELGLQLSIDLNYSDRIWPDRQEAMDIIQLYCSYNPLIKISEDDCFRIFNEEKSEAFIFDYFHSHGADTVCLTKGKDGVVLSDRNTGIIKQDAQRLDNIHDTTGAGDAFWTGFLYARLKGYNFTDTLTLAQKIAGLKLQNIKNWETII